MLDIFFAAKPIKMFGYRFQYRYRLRLFWTIYFVYYFGFEAHSFV